MLEAVSQPASLAALLAARGTDAAAITPETAAAEGLHPVPLFAAAGDGNASSSPKLGNGDYHQNGSAGAQHAMDGKSGGNGDAGSLVAGGAAWRRAAPRRSLSRELAVVFWRTLVDILRNPSLLLLHWCA
jgi:hypothetical protein